MSDILEKIYAAPFELSVWAEVVDSVASLLSAARGGQFHIFDLEHQQIIYSCMPSWIPRSAETEYNEHYAVADPRRHLLQRSPLGAWQYDQEHFDSRYVSRSGVFQFLIGHGVRYSALTQLDGGSGTSVAFCIMRATDQRQFRAEERDALLRLSPHLVRAAKLTMAFADLRERVSLGQNGLDTLADGVVVVDARGVIKLQNDAAKALLMEGSAIAEKGGRLRFVDADSHVRLGKALAAAAKYAVGAAVDIRAKSGAPALSCRVVLLPQSGPLSETGGQRRILFVFRRSGAGPSRVRTLATLFGLTSAEARVAERLVAGSTPGEIAASLDLSIATVRSHLSSLLHKTNVRRQSELVTVFQTNSLIVDA